MFFEKGLFPGYVLIEAQLIQPASWSINKFIIKWSGIWNDQQTITHLLFLVVDLLP